MYYSQIGGKQRGRTLYQTIYFTDDRDHNILFLHFVLQCAHMVRHETGGIPSAI